MRSISTAASRGAITSRFISCAQFRQIAPPQPNYEIVAHGFFATDELPADTSRATRERIAEVLTGRAAAEIVVSDFQLR